MEGKLYTVPNTGHFLISNAEGPLLIPGQAIEVFLGGCWISGQVASENGESDNSTPQANSGANQTTGEDDDEQITEASQESFPASDPPAWTTSPHRKPQLHQSLGTHTNLYFVAESDGSICGFCSGMLVRARQ